MNEIPDMRDFRSIRLGYFGRGVDSVNHELRVQLLTELNSSIFGNDVTLDNLTVEHLRGRLEPIRDAVARNTQISPKKAAFCAPLCLDIIREELSERMIEDFKNDDKGKFSAHFDVFMGAAKLLTDLSLASSALTDHVENLDRKISDYAQENNRTLEEQVNAVLAIKHEFAEQKRIFDEDPSGTKLIAYSIDHVRDETVTRGFVNPHFALYGALLAKKLYELIYPLAEGMTAE